MALGATSREILLSFGKHGLALTLTGLAVGLVLAAIAARLMTALLYGFRPDYIPTVTWYLSFSWRWQLWPGLFPRAARHASIR
ncbi:MAG: hypothetical protein DMG10_26265 [Acidobacteria bacterium]|nr:MAG: hypothetical protein DMG10_26265 [Acidobacteriota bacterium]PYV30280.1 MAG: hypothetical protein DMG09_27865 [Acidobacteriota bacterium]